MLTVSGAARAPATTGAKAAVYTQSCVVSASVVHTPGVNAKSGELAKAEAKLSPGCECKFTVCADELPTAVVPKRKLVETLRMRRLVESATYKLPSESKPTPMPLPPFEPTVACVPGQPSPMAELLQLVP